MSKLRLQKGIQTFSPAYFALAMSTGIISIASRILGFNVISNWFFVINNIEFVILSLLFILRLLYFFPDFKKDLSSHSEGAGFLTITAAACILGTEYALLKYHFNVAVILWYFALCAWLVLVYSFFILVTIKKQKPTLEDGINGSWLLFVVSVQALSILGSTVAPHLNLPMPVALFINLFFYLLGVLFYLIVIGIIFYRTTFFPMKATEFKPSYWIDMGAAAITTLAGVILVKDMNGIVTQQNFIPTIKVLSVLFWIAGTWWIPVICFLEVWRHKIIPIKYNAGYWSLVFPLGVYSICTMLLADVLSLPFLKRISDLTIVFAWIAWFITFTAMCISLIKSFFLTKSVLNKNGQLQ
ncbi:MAG: tellurite resistance/C4-dicarboxylate transporter family protein [Ginsengibacter sp.]